MKKYIILISLAILTMTCAVLEGLFETLPAQFIQINGLLTIVCVGVFIVWTLNVTGLDEITEYACQVELNPFTRSMTLPLDRKWFNELPARNEHFEVFGNPNSTLDDGNGLVYKYRLKGSDAEPQIARFVIWYDETGEKPLAVEAGFKGYQMHSDLLTALMMVQFRI